MATLARPDHIKFRREADGGLVYDHENYGYEDASMYEVSDTVIDVLEFVENENDREAVESQFSPAVVATLIDRGVLADVE
ncbi:MULTISPECIES: mycofactocin biosynthesis chaperone MftB2 [Haloferacaceae]|uniref:Mycofactocin biosynthesis chaperone MftB2 n=1 Tax=Halorubrum glutamatedens TaxID=2707018 RepID=A0ABD5QWF2_9EURY|nr:mycofactocin biosynthesis chaperone MftB2 [Halobellus captivus]